MSDLTPERLAELKRTIERHRLPDYVLPTHEASALLDAAQERNDARGERDAYMKSYYDCVAERDALRKQVEAMGVIVDKAANVRSARAKHEMRGTAADFAALMDAEQELFDSLAAYAR